MTFIEETGYGVLVSVKVHPRFAVFARIPYFKEAGDLFDYRQGRPAFPGEKEPPLHKARHIVARAHRAMEKAGYRVI